MHDDGLAYVKSFDDKTGMIAGKPKHRMGGDDGLVDAPEALFDAILESAEECP